MIPHVLDSTFERVRRAEEHLADLRGTLANVLRKQENSVTVQLNPNPPHYPKPILEGPTFAIHRIGILIGETCYNMRTALDYLIFELVKLDSGAPQNFTQFPIVDSKDKFRSWKRTTGKGINPAHIAELQRLQPYAGCDWTKTLRDISNPDKHRELAPIAGTVRIHAYTRESIAHFDEIHETSIITTHHPITGKNVEVKIHFAGSVKLADGTPIVETLEEIKSQVTNTLICFKREF